MEGQGKVISKRLAKETTVPQQKTKTMCTKNRQCPALPPETRKRSDIRDHSRLPVNVYPSTFLSPSPCFCLVPGLWTVAVPMTEDKSWHTS